MTPLLGFSPDLEPTTPGAITACNNLVPYESGMKASSTLVDVGLDALADVCQGAGLTRDLNGNSRLFAGTDTNIYEGAGASWTSVGSGYVLSVDDRWRFTIFGNASLAVSPATVLQRSLSGAFAAVAGAPKAKAMVSTRGFVLLFATDEATYGSSPDRWWCSAYLDETDWSPNVATQCTTGRLVGGSGPITAALRFGDDVVAYKERAVFFGQYSGAPEVWNWKQIGFDVGCVGVEAVVDTSIGHIFVGSDNIYVFDGTRPAPIADNTVRQWWLDNSSSQYRYRTRLLWDRDNNIVMMFYPSVSSQDGMCDMCLVYHVAAKRWGLIEVTNEAIVTYSSGGITYDGGSPLITDYDSGPMIAFDSPFWLTSKSSPGVFDTDHVLKTFTGVPGESFFVTGDYGDEEGESMCTALRLRFAHVPNELTCTGYTRDMSGDAITTGETVDFVEGKFGFRQNGRFHRFRVDMSGSVEVSAVRPNLVLAGRR